jgi:hypothetical protein
MATITQQRSRPTPTNRRRCQVSLSGGGNFAVKHGKRTTPDLNREVAIANQFARKHDDRGSMANEEDPFVLPAEAPLYLGDEHGQKARDAVVHRREALAQARRVPHGRPGIVDLGKVTFQGARVRRAGVEPRPGFDRVVPFGYTCGCYRRGWRWGRQTNNELWNRPEKKISQSRVLARMTHRVRHRSECPTPSPWVATFADSDLGIRWRW